MSGSCFTKYVELQFLYIKEAFCPSLEEQLSVLEEVCLSRTALCQIAFKILVK